MAIPVFRPGLYAEIMLSLLRLGRKHKNYSNPFRICIFLFLSYSFGIEAIKMFIHPGSSLENPTRFQTKMGKVYTRFQTKMAQKPYPMGRHIPILLIYIRDYPPGWIQRNLIRPVLKEQPMLVVELWLRLPVSLLYRAVKFLSQSSVMSVTIPEDH